MTNEERIELLEKQIQRLMEMFNEHTHILREEVPGTCGCCSVTETHETESPENKVH